MNTYRIKPGDTLNSIARKLGVSEDSLAKANNLKDRNVLFAGAELKLRPQSTFRTVGPGLSGLPNISGTQAPAAKALSSTGPVSTAAAKRSTGDKLLASAMSQLGDKQDCTAMVERALRSVGKKVGDIAPADFFKYGKKVSTPRPGDLVYYNDGGAGVPHIAIFKGKGQAVHGGWEGGTTAVGPVNVGKGPASYIRVS